jgi:cytochrome oxidase Cu insertion factor (SCO1/SenC/PrrC family)
MSLSRQQYTLLGIFGLFLGPVLLVILMRSSWWQYQPSGLKNHGHLVQPPTPLTLDQSQDFKGKWLILFELEQPCDQTCQERVTTIRQTHRAAGRHAEHLAIVLLSKTPVETTLRSRLEQIYPEFNFVTDSTNTAFTTLSEVKEKTMIDSAQVNDIYSYILDPMLNVILAYDTEADPGDMHKDLKRLLKWSDQEGRK